MVKCLLVRLFTSHPARSDGHWSCTTNASLCSDGCSDLDILSRWNFDGEIYIAQPVADDDDDDCDCDEVDGWVVGEK